MLYVCQKWNKDLLGKNVADKAKVEMLKSKIRDVRSAAYLPCFGEVHELSVFEPSLEPHGKILDFMKANGTQFLVADYVTFVDF